VEFGIENGNGNGNGNGIGDGVRKEIGPGR
jgi:hypothetical protein